MTAARLLLPRPPAFVGVDFVSPCFLPRAAASSFLFATEQRRSEPKANQGRVKSPLKRKWNKGMRVIARFAERRRRNQREINDSFLEWLSF